MTNKIPVMAQETNALFFEAMEIWFEGTKLFDRYMQFMNRWWKNILNSCEA